MKKDKEIKKVKHSIVFKFRRWLKRMRCYHYWVKYKVPYNPNKYPSNIYRKCTECGEIQWADLYGRFKGNKND